MKKQVQKWGIAVVALSVGLVQVVFAANDSTHQQQSKIQQSTSTMIDNSAHPRDLMLMKVRTHSGEIVSAYIPKKEIKKLSHKAQKDLYWSSGQ